MRATVDTLQLGHSGIEIAPLGVGAMSWANRSVMSYGGADSPQEEVRALEECLAAGVTLVDTAEAYGRGAPNAASASWRGPTAR